MIYIGIDPGFTGAVAMINGAEMSIVDTPTVEFKHGKRTRPEFDEHGMVRVLTQIMPFSTRSTDVRVGIEDVGPRPMEGVVSVGRFMKGYGLWLGIIAALGLQCEKIRPQTWKRDVFGESGMEKDASVARAEQLCATIQFRTLRGKLLDGRAEALLIADYVRRHAK